MKIFCANIARVTKAQLASCAAQPSGVDFTNALRASFACAYSKSAKDTDDLIVILRFSDMRT